MSVEILDGKPDTFSGWGAIHVIFLLVAYAFVLMRGSSMISDGSELLLLVPSLKGIVGSVVLPVLGAVGTVPPRRKLPVDPTATPTPATRPRVFFLGCMLAPTAERA
jgi:hypothetical protein